MRQDMYGVIWILIRTKEMAFEKMLQSNMHKIINKQYQNLLDDKTKGRLLTPDGLRFICSASNYDPTEIGKIMLENLANLQAKGAVSMHPGQDVDSSRCFVLVPVMPSSV